MMNVILFICCGVGFCAKKLYVYIFPYHIYEDEKKKKYSDS